MTDTEFLNWIDTTDFEQAALANELNGHSGTCDRETCMLDGIWCEGFQRATADRIRNDEDADEGSRLLGAWTDMR